MDRLAQLGTAATAALAATVAACGGPVASPGGTGGPGGSPLPSAAATATAAPTPGGTPLASSGLVFPPAGPLQVGRHDFSEDGIQFSLAITATGWTSSGPQIEAGGGNLTRGVPTAGSGAWLVVWGIDGAYSDPCGARSGPVAGPSRADLATAVAGIPGVDVTDPSDVTVNGYAATYLTVTIPEGIGCAPDEFFLWFNDTRCGSFEPCGRYASAVNSIIRIWIVDVEGTRVWLEAETYEGATPELDAEIQAMIDSIEFE
jgi:hypothetical protein